MSNIEAFPKQLNAKVDTDTYEKIKALAKKNHASLSTIARNLIIKGLAQGNGPSGQILLTEQ